MPFPFTFKLAVPGILNPFSAPDEPLRTAPVVPSESLEIINRKLAEEQAKYSRRRPSPASSALPMPPMSRKRGWDPSLAEPSQSTTTLASSSGYLDTPAKYRDLACTSHDDYVEIQDMAASAAGMCAYLFISALVIFHVLAVPFHRARCHKTARDASFFSHIPYSKSCLTDAFCYFIDPCRNATS